MQQKRYYVANWKMQKTFNEARAWIKDYESDLVQLSADNEIILCPSFISLASLITESHVCIGAQNCSSHDAGPFTGEVSARSLKEIGCRYCIIGHSERRRIFNETDEVVVAKFRQVLQHDISPIVCIGETLEALSAGQREGVLMRQLAMIFQESERWNNKKIMIAYEPVWAIGSDMTPDVSEMSVVFAMLAQRLESVAGHHNWYLLYGGSVSGKNATEFKKIKLLDGFLIGKASLDFQEFKKIVS